MTTTHNSELINYAIEGLNNVNAGTYGCDLHHELFNTDYFIIGYYQAKQWLIANVGIFAAIGEIVKYEKDNFGEVSTDIESSEKVVNMYAYIKGEEILSESKTLQDKWDNQLTDEDIQAIKDELNELL